MSGTTVWIDLANSPHPLLFEPICDRLERAGAKVAVTVRDHAQTLELSRRRWPGASVVGGPSRDGRVAKAAGIAARVRELARWARARRPDVALSHNSYAQILAARALRIPAVTAMDYEHQPANHVAFRGASRILLPEALPADVVARQGASRAKVIRYPGYKEALYLRGFVPDPEVLARLGLAPAAGEGAANTWAEASSEGRDESAQGTGDGVSRSAPAAGERPAPIVAVARAAPAGAAYHPGENPLFLEVLRELGARPGVRTVVLARHPAQRAAIEKLALPGLLAPEAVVDSRSLLCAADLFVGAGGTMTREAALLGVPTYSIFAGRPPAVDLRLEREGRLLRLDAVEQLRLVRAESRPTGPDPELEASGREIEEAFVAATLEAAPTDPPAPRL